jgi:hypothetical protein
MDVSLANATTGVPGRKPVATPALRYAGQPGPRFTVDTVPGLLSAASHGMRW